MNAGESVPDATQRTGANFIEACVRAGFVAAAFAAATLATRVSGSVELQVLATAAAISLLAVPPLIRRRSRKQSDRPAPPPEAGRPQTVPLAGLTPRQDEAVTLAAAGLRQTEIAESMGISIHQVRNLLSQARRRTGAGTTRELIAIAMTQRIPFS